MSAPDDDEDPMIVCCQGPPRCDYDGSGNPAERMNDCPWCKRVIVHAGGRETVIQPGYA